MKIDNEKLVMLFSDKTKRKLLTPMQKTYFWENPRMYPRTCSICMQRITRIPDVELDNTKEYSEKENNLVLTHRACSRELMKANQ